MGQRVDSYDSVSRAWLLPCGEIPAATWAVSNPSCDYKARVFLGWEWGFLSSSPQFGEDLFNGRDLAWRFLVVS